MTSHRSCRNGCLLPGLVRKNDVHHHHHRAAEEISSRKSQQMGAYHDMFAWIACLFIASTTIPRVRLPGTFLRPDKTASALDRSGHWSRPLEKAHGENRKADCHLAQRYLWQSKCHLHTHKKGQIKSCRPRSSKKALLGRAGRTSAGEQQAQQVFKKPRL
jgi:hypothetical protein